MMLKKIFFICLAAIFVSSSVKYLFMYLAHFLIGLFDFSLFFFMWFSYLERLSFLIFHFWVWKFFIYVVLYWICGNYFLPVCRLSFLPNRVFYRTKVFNFDESNWSILHSWIMFFMSSLTLCLFLDSDDFLFCCFS